MKKTTAKRIAVSVTNDLIADNRVHKICTTLIKMGFNVLLVGRKLPHSQPIRPRGYQTKRLKLVFVKGPFFYAEFNFRLFLLLLFSKNDVLLSNDLDTLPANFLASKMKKLPLVYDSHEYFTEVPELIHRPVVQRVWKWIEKRTVPHIKYAYTVCQSIASVYAEKYGTTFRVVRNLPAENTFFQFNQPDKKPGKMILYQGALNIGRGLEQVIRAMHFIENARLVIAGDGDIASDLKKLVQLENLQNKVEFKGRLPLEELAKLTPQADLGLSVEEDLGLNYRFALPNKLFDYIQAEVPVLVSNLPEMAAVVKKYEIGKISHSHEPEQLAKTIQEALFDEEKRMDWKKNLKTAARELTWENEEKVVQEIFERFI